jgi:hypothetical protein
MLNALSMRQLTNRRSWVGAAECGCFRVRLMESTTHQRYQYCTNTNLAQARNRIAEMARVGVTADHVFMWIMVSPSSSVWPQRFYEYGRVRK